MTAKGRINAASLTVGTRILVTTDHKKAGAFSAPEGALLLARVKTGVQVATVVELQATVTPGRHRASRTYNVVTDLGTVKSLVPIQTMWLAPEANAQMNADIAAQITQNQASWSRHAECGHHDATPEGLLNCDHAAALMICLECGRTDCATNLDYHCDLCTSVDDHSTREEWLVAAVARITPLFTEIGRTMPPVRVSVGWPGGRGKKNRTIGQCWAKGAAADGVSQIFISPVLDAVPVVLETLVHELVHAVDNCASDHKGDFVKMARRLGLAGKPTATHAGDELAAKLAKIAARLGAYPHAAMTVGADGAEGPKKQTTRMVKVECGECGYIARTTRQHLERAGAPICPCNKQEMALA